MMQLRDTVLVRTDATNSLVGVASEFLYFTKVQVGIREEAESAAGLRPEIRSDVHYAGRFAIPSKIAILPFLREGEDSLEVNEVVDNGPFWKQCNNEFRTNPSFADFRPAARPTGRDENDDSPLAVLSGVIDGIPRTDEDVKMTGESSGLYDVVIRPLWMTQVKSTDLPKVGERIAASLKRIEMRLRAVKETPTTYNQLVKLQLPEASLEVKVGDQPHPLMTFKGKESVFPMKELGKFESVVFIINTNITRVREVTQVLKSAEAMDALFESDDPLSEKDQVGTRSDLYNVFVAALELDAFARYILPRIELTNADNRKLIQEYANKLGPVDYNKSFDPDRKIAAFTMDEDTNENRAAAYQGAKEAIASFFIRYDSIIKLIADIIDGKTTSPPASNVSEGTHEQGQAVVIVNDAILQTISAAVGIAAGLYVGEPQDAGFAAAIFGGVFYYGASRLNEGTYQLTGLRASPLFETGSFSGFTRETISKILTLNRRAQWLGWITFLGWGAVYWAAGASPAGALLLSVATTVANHFTDVVAYLIGTVGVGFFEQSSWGQSFRRNMSTRAYDVVRNVLIYAGSLAIVVGMTWTATSLLAGDAAVFANSAVFLTPTAAYIMRTLKLNWQALQGVFAGPGLFQGMTQGTMQRLFGVASGNITGVGVIDSILSPLITLAAFLGSSAVNLASTVLGLFTVVVPVFGRVMSLSQSEIQKQTDDFKREIFNKLTWINSTRVVTLDDALADVTQECLNAPIVPRGGTPLYLEFGSPNGIVTNAYVGIRESVATQISAMNTTAYDRAFSPMGYVNKEQAIEHYSLVLTQQCDNRFVRDILEGKNSGILDADPNTLTTLFNDGTRLFANRNTPFTLPTGAPSRLGDTISMLESKEPVSQYYAQVSTKALNVEQFYNKWYENKFLPATRTLRGGATIDSTTVKTKISGIVKDVNDLNTSMRQAPLTADDTFTAIPNIFMKIAADGASGTVITLMKAVGTFFDRVADRYAIRNGYTESGQQETLYASVGSRVWLTGGHAKTAFGFALSALTATIVGTIYLVFRVLKDGVGVIFSLITAPFRLLTAGADAAMRILTRAGGGGGGGGGGRGGNPPGVAVYEGQPGGGTAGSRSTRSLSPAQEAVRLDEQRRYDQNQGGHVDAITEALGDPKRPLEEEAETDTSTASTASTKRARMSESETEAGSSQGDPIADGEATLVKIVQNLGTYSGIRCDKLGYLLTTLMHSEFLVSRLEHVIVHLSRQVAIDTNALPVDIIDLPFSSLSMDKSDSLIDFSATPEGEDDQRTMKLYVDTLLGGFNTRRSESDIWKSVLDLLVIAAILGQTVGESALESFDI